MDDPLDVLFLTPEEALVLEMKQWPQSKRDALKSMLDRREAALNAQKALAEIYVRRSPRTLAEFITRWIELSPATRELELITEAPPSAKGEIDA